MKIIMKVNENTICEADLNNSSVSFITNVHNIIVKSEEYKRIGIFCHYNHQAYNLYSCMVPIDYDDDVSMIYDFLRFVSKEITRHVYKEINNKNGAFINMIGLNDNIMKSTITQMDAPKLDKWHDYDTKIHHQLELDGLNEGKKFMIDYFKTDENAIHQIFVEYLPSEEEQNTEGEGTKDDANDISA